MIDVLAFGPHPDDVELFAGGTMIRLGVVDSIAFLRTNPFPEAHAFDDSDAP